MMARYDTTYNGEVDYYEFIQNLMEVLTTIAHHYRSLFAQPDWLCNKQKLERIQSALSDQLQETKDGGSPPAKRGVPALRCLPFAY